MMKFMLVFLIFTLSSIFIFAGLDDFSDEVNKEIEKSDKYSQNDSEAKKNNNADLDSDCFRGIFSFLLTETIKGWYYFNYMTFYNSFPYSNKPDKNVAFYGFLPNTDFYNNLKFNQKYVQSINENDYNLNLNFENCKKYNLHLYYLTIESYYSYIFDTDYSVGAAFSGKLGRFFGPEFEFRHIKDDDLYLNYMASGINLAISQYDYFAADFYVQHAKMSGVTNLQGVVCGLIIRSFFYDPFSITLKGGMHYYQYELKFYDLEGRLSYHLNRFEVFSGYRHLGSDFNAHLGGPLFGVKLWL